MRKRIRNQKNQNNKSNYLAPDEDVCRGIGCVGWDGAALGSIST